MLVNNGEGQWIAFLVFLDTQTVSQTSQVSTTLEMVRWLTLETALNQVFQTYRVKQCSVGMFHIEKCHVKFCWKSFV